MPLETLFDRIENRCGSGDAEAVSEIFNSLGQRMPDIGQYRKGHESDTVFSNKLGLVFRIAYSNSFVLPYSLRHNENPLIIQPLKKSFDLDNLSFEICPAVDCVKGVSGDELLFLQKRLLENGINFWDIQKTRRILAFYL